MLLFNSKGEHLPIGFRIRSSIWFITLTVTLATFTDIATYGLMIPYIPFRLEKLGYSNSASLSGWLIAAYAGGLIVSSPPIAWLGELGQRRTQLLLYLTLLAGGTVLFMLSTSFTPMVVARIFQGFAGTGTWILGLSLVGDSVPEERVSEIMGYVMLGFSAGGSLGYPLGGILYQKLGYRAPSVLALSLIFVDFVLRLLIIEREPALKMLKRRQEYIDKLTVNAEKTANDSIGDLDAVTKKDLLETEVTDDTLKTERKKSMEEIQDDPSPQSLRPASVKTKTVHPIKALVYLCQSRRAMTLFFMSGSLGVVLSALLDTGIPIHLDEKYGMDPLIAGVVILGASVPNFVVGPLGGVLADRYGARLIVVISLLLALPWYSVLAIPSNSLATFIVFLILAFSLQNGAMAPVMGDLAKVVMQSPPEARIGFSHLYGLFNFCFSVGLFIGPIAAGQALENLGGKTGGWTFIVCLVVGVLLLQVPLAYFYVGREGSRNTKTPKLKSRERTEESTQASP